MLNHDRAAQKAASLWLKTKTEFTGNWHIDLDDQAIIVNAVAAELSKAHEEIENLTHEIFELSRQIENLEKSHSECSFIGAQWKITEGMLVIKDAEITRLRDELASIEQFAESWPCHCAENYPGATMYHGQDCQTAVAVEFVAQWRAAKVKP